MRTCLTCARFVYQEAEPGVGDADRHAVIRCARDRFHLDLRTASVEAFRRAVFAAETCDQYYEAAALKPDGEAW